ncbi:hypothetical protein PA25_13240 [Pseudoalteromonas sp. A25]|uniref:hypothetical protein n=1 Tax=Pseudoalteromonas sp. A25 TaxID=116092 RepID=UPI001260539C|nr:hypothetical protein [Pseudoalteromonas sp. A25]BBN81339.1 hypothetical protein PA25_13240 [Pseudoalteromonas sp. A25]
MKKLSATLCLAFISSIAFAKDMYRSPGAGDSGAYYILESKNLGGNVVEVLSSRIGKNDAYTDFTRLKVNCETRQYFTLAGLSEDGAKSKPTKALKDWSKNSKWSKLVPGSSKYDLVDFVCAKSR